MGLERVSLQLTSCVMDLKSSKRINYTLTIRLLQRSRGLQNKGPGVKQRDRKLKRKDWEQKKGLRIEERDSLGIEEKD